MVERLENYGRLAIHTMTFKFLSLFEIVKLFQKYEVPGITVWREHIHDTGLKESKKILTDSGLNVVSVCRGGFFPSASGREREQACIETMKAIDEAYEIGAPLLVLVCGAEPGVPLSEARQQIMDGIQKVLPHAKSAEVCLGIEPLHPMYADNRSAINMMEQANNIVSALHSEWLGIVLDVYHVWWEPWLQSEIMRAERKIKAFHVSDWKTPTTHLLTDRGLMGEGCIPIRQIRAWVEQAGFHGFIEVEIFSEKYWALPPENLIQQIKDAYLRFV
ncbi:MAG TPA: sugar phosphate isomerase/epimerase family protein [Candidatus Hydrogenedens sp.]|nr:sugar phosphate isomerase/epimerase family protein [Candidatus Hydrogenedens sp.]HOL21166.1 sugar phosphate isomerase/epimerase family protein [Candidatus Hydrogenedens sp.]HPP59983.1 sugar phosphate isomerase/epimerase family protein [Candidatus Hydrogenedens sp.]